MIECTGRKQSELADVAWIGSNTRRMVDNAIDYGGGRIRTESGLCRSIYTPSLQVLGIKSHSLSTHCWPAVSIYINIEEFQ